eukprot:GHVH01000901.1.p1 GENE.GHVH01000901.1~~GHVH01000901.1.p1  ORF type:complete len:840 (+),score=104.86 GHVH01000901.1:72-2591(+)
MRSLPHGGGTFHNKNGRQDGRTAPEMQARFAHTLTKINSNMVAMFGGAVGDPGKYNISADVVIYDAAKGTWRNIQSENDPPPRAAHAACAVNDSKLVIYGGATGGGSLSPPDVHILDLNDLSHPSWQILPTSGPGPGCRYGHMMAYSKPNIIVIGGNNGIKALSDVWTLDIECANLQWHQVSFPEDKPKPVPRVYCGGDVVREGGASSMVVIQGGRRDGVTLDDLWGLRQHRNRSWDWVPGPSKNKVDSESGRTVVEAFGLGRFQHTCIAIGTKVLIIGGRSSSPSTLLPTVSYDTESCTWSNFDFAVDRYRHAACPFPSGSDDLSTKILMYGGFQQSSINPTNQLELIDPIGENVRSMGVVVVEPIAPRSSGGSSARPSPDEHPDELPASILAPPAVAAVRNYPMVSFASHVHTTVDSSHENRNEDECTPQRVALDRLGDEGRRLRSYPVPLSGVQDPQSGVIDSMIARLLKPNMRPCKYEQDFNPNRGFLLSSEELTDLCKRVIAILRSEPMVLRLRAPIKVYGDIHGQHYDLMRMFKTYKSPVMDEQVERVGSNWDARIEGDLDSTDYLFLGDYVDRGTNSLEVISLLFALKVRYPSRIHLLRGNHEDSIINSIYGFKDECSARLNENADHPESCWSKINRVFEYLPMGALIEDKILCIHGGIGGDVNSISEIESLQRPLKVAQVPTTVAEQRVTDLLWSDPSDNDSAMGVTPNDVRDPDGSGHIVKFGPDRVVKFLQNNNLEMIIRAHECVMDGIERFAGGRLVTLFSATDYCGTHKNAGALLFVRRDLSIVPKIIYPQGRDTSHQPTPGSTWILDPTRPPTPPRSSRLIQEIFQ